MHRSISLASPRQKNCRVDILLYICRKKYITNNYFSVAFFLKTPFEKFNNHVRYDILDTCDCAHMWRDDRKSN